MATHQNCTQSANADRQNNTKSITWKTSPLTDKKNFRFKDCKAWNQYRQNNTALYIRAEVSPDYSPCASLNLPTNPNPWNVLRSVIDQFYQREADIAWKLLKAQQATEKGQKLEEKNKELQEIFWKQDKRIGELKALLEKGNTPVDHSANAMREKTVSYREFEIEKREAPIRANIRPENTTPAHYTIEDCRAYNDFQHDMCKQYSPDCLLLTLSENPHPWKSIRSLIELYYDRKRQLRFALQEIGRLKDEKKKAQEIADIALRGLYELEEKVNATHQ